MYIDERLEFADAQAVTGSGDSTDSVDLGTDRDIGPGRQLWLVISLDVATDFTSGNETYVFNLETDDNSSFSSGTDIASITFIGANPAGTRKYIGVPEANEQFLQIRRVLGGTSPSCTYSAWLTSEEPTALQAYPDAVN